MTAVLPPLQRPLTDDAAGSYTLSSEYYLSSEIYEYEKQQIFYRTWQYVAHEKMLVIPGDYITLRICDENIFVVRSDDGKLRAFYNICKHRAHELLSGAGNIDNLIVCPYHAWSYDRQGDLIRAPMSEQRSDFNKADFCLQPIRLEIFCGFIFVNLDSDADSLQSIAGELETDIREHVPYIEELQLSSNMVPDNYPIEAGWKVVVDNYVECYHCRKAHPDFSSIIDMDVYQVEVHDYWSRQYGPDIRTDNTAYPLDGNNELEQSVFWYLWPNTTFNVMPGPEALGVFSIRPLGIDQAVFDGHSLTTNGEVYQPRYDYFQDVLAPEDVGLCESVQRGLKSRSYDQGAYMVDPQKTGDSEYGLHHFHLMVRNALNTG